MMHVYSFTKTNIKNNRYNSTSYYNLWDMYYNITGYEF